MGKDKTNNYVLVTINIPGLKPETHRVKSAESSDYIRLVTALSGGVAHCIIQECNDAL